MHSAWPPPPAASRYSINLTHLFWFGVLSSEEVIMGDGALIDQDLNRDFRALISLICESIEEFRSYDLDRIAISLSTSKGNGKFGVWAYVVPLRYVGGKPERRGFRWGLPGSYRYESAKITQHQPGAHYLMTFLVPKFFRLSSDERLETIVHELYHLHPSLRGDLRRFPAPHIHHGPTPAAYRAKVKSLAAEGRRNFTALLEHPLLMGRPEDFEMRKKMHLPIPRRVFRPFGALFGDRGQVASWLFATVGLLGFANAAQALRVTALRAGTIYAEPSGQAEKVDSFDKGQSFEAKRLSSTKSWVEVQGAHGKGWVPRRWVGSVTAGSEPTTEAKSAVPDEDAGSIGEEGFESGASSPKMDVNAGLAEVDAQSAAQRATRSGKLFEKANPMSERFGLVEKGDELKIIKKSSGGKWVFVRILTTGEEGWYPATWVEVEKVERMNRFGRFAVEGFLGYGTADYRIGFGGGFSYNLFPQGFAGRPRDRLEVGVFYSKFLGATYVDGSLEATTAFVQAGALARYVGTNDTGSMAVAGEGGFVWDDKSVDGISSFSSANITQYNLTAGSSIGFLAGAMGLLAISESFQLQAGVRLRIGGNFMTVTHVGAALRF